MNIRELNLASVREADNTEPSLARVGKEGVETMYLAPREEGEDMVRPARIDEGADADRNDRRLAVAWAAGFVDGEACIQIARNYGGRDSASYSLHLSVDQIDPAPLEELKRLFGGTIFWRKAGTANRRNPYRWTLSARQAARALEEMLPFFHRKGEEAELAIELQTLLSSRKRNDNRRLTDEEVATRHDYYERLKALHAKRWS